MENNINQPFKGIKILFIDGLSNLYHTGIVDALMKMEAELTVRRYRDFQNRSFISLLLKKVFNINNFREQYFLNSLSDDYDIIFIKDPLNASVAFFKKLRIKYSRTKFVNFNWNSIKLFDYRAYIKIFDIVYSFDHNDASSNGIRYYPLFYLPQFEKIALSNEGKYKQLVFVGSLFLSIERKVFLEKLVNLLRKMNYEHHFHIYLTFLREKLKFKFVWRKSILNDYISDRFLDFDSYLEICKKSNAQIDFKKKLQVGHTIRVFETLSTGAMLVTNDEMLKKAPFYDPKRIKIIGDNLSGLDLEEVKAWVPSFPDNFKKYRVDYWLQHILLND